METSVEMNQDEEFQVVSPNETCKLPKSKPLIPTTINNSYEVLEHA